MNLFHSEQSLLARFFLFSIPVAIVAAVSLVYFGSKLNPDKNNSQPINYASRSLEVVTYSRSVIANCVENQSTDRPEECQDLKEILQILQSAVDTAAMESIAESAFQMRRFNYWLFLTIAWTAILIMLAVGAFLTLFFETSQASKHISNILRVISDSRESELQPYLNIVDVSVQTGEPPFGGGDGWIDITFKNLGKTPAQHFRNHIIEAGSDEPQFSQYVEVLDGIPIVHAVESPAKTGAAGKSPDTILLDFINAGEERTVRCPIVTDIRDRRIKLQYMEGERARLRDGATLPRFEGYRIRGSVDFSNIYFKNTTRRLKYELSDSIDNSRAFRIIEDKIISL